MVRFKPVPSLAECVKREIPAMVRNHIIRSAYNLNISWQVKYFAKIKKKIAEKGDFSAICVLLVY